MTTTHDRAMHMLSIALEMEEKGKKFYDDAIAKCANPLGREIFQMLARDEVVHVERIKAIYSSLEGGHGWTEAWTQYEPTHGSLNPIFRDLAKKHGSNIQAATGDLDALAIGIDFEMKAVEFYAGHLKDATDERERHFIEHMIQEEKGHHEVLAEMKFYLEDPTAWFAEKEHIGFDGA